MVPSDAEKAVVRLRGLSTGDAEAATCNVGAAGFIQHDLDAADGVAVLRGPAS